MSKGNNQLKIKDMKKYYVNGMEITEQEAKTIEARNAEYMNGTDFSYGLNASSLQ